MARILIVEDEEHLSRFIDKGLRKAGYETVVAVDGMAALEHATGGEVDLVVLDVGLPRMDGFTVLKLIRGMDVDVPVIMCTARDSAEDKVAGLEGGADDYLAKPYTFAELLARIKLRLRDHGPATTEATRLERDDLVLDIVTREVTVGGEPVTLSAREFTLLRAFVEHPGQVLSREQLIERVWDGAETSSNVVDVYIGYLRGKIGAARILTVRGLGYRFP
ncbi:response regulator transcription factor [Janibacter sp. YIM B02568]|uniref:response regulator transcription factor n=1 Tax=Janibacter endophyticus TaxID=2806261 RepID=UPI00194F4423|nr:response regulator transcription factor [Janibacter endophyticus]MBM6545178.1 response regulator transcription factor [Janibacter endophyticus]